MSEQDSMDAAAALARAQELHSEVRKKSSWHVRYQLAYGGAAGATVLMLGLLDSRVGAAVAMAFWALVIVTLSRYAARQPVARWGLTRRHGLMILAWTVLYAIVLAVGIGSLRGDPAWWVPAAVVVALPGLIGAYLEARR